MGLVPDIGATEAPAGARLSTGSISPTCDGVGSSLPTPAARFTGRLVRSRAEISVSSASLRLCVSFIERGVRRRGVDARRGGYSLCMDPNHFWRAAPLADLPVVRKAMPHPLWRRYFRCRKCHGLTYESQYEQSWQRVITRASESERNSAEADRWTNGSPRNPRACTGGPTVGLRPKTRRPTTFGRRPSWANLESAFDSNQSPCGTEGNRLSTISSGYGPVAARMGCPPQFYVLCLSRHGCKRTWGIAEGSRRRYCRRSVPHVWTTRKLLRPRRRVRNLRTMCSQHRVRDRRGPYRRVPIVTRYSRSTCSPASVM